MVNLFMLYHSILLVKTRNQDICLKLYSTFCNAPNKLK